MTVKTVYWFGWMPEYHLRSRLVRWLGVTIVYALAVNLFVWLVHVPEWPGGDKAVAALGLVFSVLLTFRLNNAYDRWWEARKQWGQLINDTRNLVLKTRFHIATDLEDMREFGGWVSAFPHALRCHLRREQLDRSFPNADRIPANVTHVPIYVAGIIQAKLNQWAHADCFGPTSGLYLLDPHTRGLMDVCGACERIRNTPMTTSMRSLIRGGIALLGALAPWSLAPTMGFWSLPPIILQVGLLYALEITAEEIEEPFGRSRDDLPLDSFCRSLEQFVADTFDPATPLPSWIEPLADGRAASETARE